MNNVNNVLTSIEIKSSLKNKDKPKSFFYQSIHTISTKGILLIMGVATGIITARFLGPEGKGLIAMFQVLPAMVISFGELGIRQSTAYLIGQKKYEEKDIQACLVSVYFISITINLIVIFFGYQNLGLFKYGWLISIIFILMAPVALLQRYANGLLLGRKEIEKINYIQLVNKGGALILIILFIAWFKWGVMGAGISFLMAQCFAVLLLLFWISHYASLKPKLISPIIREMLKKGILFALSLFVLQLNYRVDILMLGKMQTEVSVGIYSVGVGICELLKQIPLAVGVVLFSHSTNWLKSQKNKSLSKVAFITRIMLIISFISALLLAIVAKWFIPLLYGIKFQESIMVIWYLLPGIIVLTIFINIQLFMSGQGKPEFSLYAFSPALILNIILNIYLIPRLDYIGAALSSTISYSVAVILYCIIFSTFYNIKIMDFIFCKKEDFRYLWLLIKKNVKGL